MALRVLSTSAVRGHCISLLSPRAKLVAHPAASSSPWTCWRAMCHKNVYGKGSAIRCGMALSVRHYHPPVSTVATETLDPLGKPGSRMVRRPNLVPVGPAMAPIFAASSTRRTSTNVQRAACPDRPRRSFCVHCKSHTRHRQLYRRNRTRHPLDRHVSKPSGQPSTSSAILCHTRDIAKCAGVGSSPADRSAEYLVIAGDRCQLCQVPPSYHQQDITGNQALCDR